MCWSLVMYQYGKQAELRGTRDENQGVRGLCCQKKKKKVRVIKQKAETGGECKSVWA